MQVALLHAPTIETCAFVLFVSTKSSGERNTALARGQAGKRIQTCMQQEDSKRYIFLQLYIDKFVWRVNLT